MTLSPWKYLNLLIFLSFRLNACARSVVNLGGPQLFKDGNYGKIITWMEVKVYVCGVKLL